MNTEELNVLGRFEVLVESSQHLVTAREIIADAKKVYAEIIDIRNRLAEIDNETYFESKRMIIESNKSVFIKPAGSTDINH
jgi:hypothetical protein